MKIVLIMLASIFANAQAGSKHEKVRYTDVPFDVVSFEKNVKPLLENRCATCHYNGSSLINLLQYDVAFKNGEKLKQAVTNGKMPLRDMTGLSKVEQYIIQKWVDGGMKQ